MRPPEGGSARCLTKSFLSRLISALLFFCACALVIVDKKMVSLESEGAGEAKVKLEVFDKMPNINIAGLHKAGTSQLNYIMGQHPDVLGHSGQRKEYCLTRDKGMANYKSSLQDFSGNATAGDYLGMPATAAHLLLLRYLTCLLPCPPGDCHFVSNIFLEPKTNPLSPLVLLPLFEVAGKSKLTLNGCMFWWETNYIFREEYIASKTKFIVILRDPVDLLWSTYHYFHGKGGICVDQRHKNANVKPGENVLYDRESFTLNISTATFSVQQPVYLPSVSDLLKSQSHEKWNHCRCQICDASLVAKHQSATPHHDAIMFAYPRLKTDKQKLECSPVWKFEDEKFEEGLLSPEHFHKQLETNQSASTGRWLDIMKGDGIFATRYTKDLVDIFGKKVRAKQGN